MGKAGVERRSSVAERSRTGRLGPAERPDFFGGAPSAPRERRSEAGGTAIRSYWCCSWRSLNVAEPAATTTRSTRGGDACEIRSTFAVGERRKGFVFVDGADGVGDDPSSEHEQDSEVLERSASW